MNTRSTGQRGKSWNTRLPSFFKSNSWKIGLRGEEQKESKPFRSKTSEMFLGLAELPLKTTIVKSSKQAINGVNEKSLISKEQSPKGEKVYSSIVQPATEFTDLPGKVKELSPKTEELTAKFVELRSKENRKMSAENVTFVPQDVSATSFEDKNPKETKDCRIVSPKKTKDCRIVSPPSFQKCYFVLKYGEKLTEAGKNMSEQEMKLLYEDIFKPVDIYSLLKKSSAGTGCCYNSQLAV